MLFRMSMSQRHFYSETPSGCMLVVTKRTEAIETEGLLGRGKARRIQVGSSQSILKNILKTFDKPIVCTVEKPGLSVVEQAGQGSHLEAHACLLMIAAPFLCASPFFSWPLIYCMHFQVHSPATAPRLPSWPMLKGFLFTVI